MFKRFNAVLFGIVFTSELEKFYVQAYVMNQLL